MPFCTQCGHENPADAKFCAQCGSRLATAPPAEPVVDSTTTMTIPREEAERDDSGDLGPADQGGVDALPEGSALLVVLRGPNAGSRFLLDTDLVKAGRHPDSDIFLDDVTVSRRHAEFRRTPNGFVVTDVGSLNGTYVNRDRIDEVAGSLSGGEQQMLTLAQALIARPRLLMIDELSLGLAPAVVESLLGFVRALSPSTRCWKRA
jgi:hypothetical protein